MSEKPGDWAELAARADAHALPPSDYGSTRAIQSVAALLRAAYERGQSEAIAAWNRRAGGEGWQPIETAPRDGTWILGWARSDSAPYRISWGRNHDARLAWCTAFASFVGGYMTNSHPWARLALDILHVAELVEVAGKHQVGVSAKSSHAVLAAACVDMMKGREVMRAVCGALRARVAFGAASDPPIGAPAQLHRAWAFS